MNKALKTQQVSEGITDFLVFKNKVTVKGPGAKEKVPFYNPAMELNRDLSILVCQWLVNNSSKRVHILDGLASSGARGTRLKKEVKGDFDITVNDWDEEAYKLILENIEHLKLTDVSVLNKNLNSLLSEKKIDYIDVDPFGSPAYFIDSAMRSILDKGILACTATDTATLCGVYPKVCNRRYGANPFHSFFMKEVGLRILVGFICKEAVKYDKGIKPLLCHSTDHYFRVYIMIRNSVDSANDSIKNLSMIPSDKFVFSKNKGVDVGPLWTGKLQDKKMIKELRTILFEKKLNTKNTLWKLLDLLEEEADAPNFFYTTDEVASFLKLSPPRLNMVFKQLENNGFKVYHTHFSNTGFKTIAPIKDIQKVFENNL